MVIRPNRQRTALNEKGDYNKLIKQSKKLQEKNNVFSHIKYLRYAMTLGIVGFALSKIVTNVIFVKKSDTNEMVEYQQIENSNKLKEYSWMTKLLKFKNEN